MPRAKAPADDRNYIFKIGLLEVKDPQVTRTLSVPPSITFHKFHYAIQIAFGWANVHLYRFQILNLRATSHTYASTGRRNVVPKVLMALDGPGMDDPSIFDDEDEIRNKSSEVKISDVFEVAKYRNKHIQYLYDFGDDWDHKVTFIGRADQAASDTIVCLEGEGGSVSEDCGGVWGWESMKAMYARQKDNEEDEGDEKEMEQLEWYGVSDPWHFCKEDVNERLAEIDEEMRSDERRMGFVSDSD